MKHDVLLSWIGYNDLKASNLDPKAGNGPIGQAVHTHNYTHIWLLTNFTSQNNIHYIEWLKKQTKSKITILTQQFKNPTDYEAIYEAGKNAAEKANVEFGSDARITYHLSPGTPTMTAIWLFLAKTIYPAHLIQSSPEKGVVDVELPFDIAVDYLPELAKKTDNDIVLLAQGLPPESPEFEQIIHNCAAMKRVIIKARRIAVHNVPVLLLGESGTGKELFARAIHFSSPRAKKPLITVNCGAIPENLIESELFGYIKGAFTGADTDHDGFIKSADRGTLFLDEIGELSKQAQVKLLRVLQNGTFQKVGSTKETKVDIRVIAATNVNIQQEVVKGNFREDLFHRIAVGVLTLPPLRERKGDISLLADYFLKTINCNNSNTIGWSHKKLSAGARNIINQHIWSGNIRELINTLSRAAIWSTGQTITKQDMEEAIFSLGLYSIEKNAILNRPLGCELDLKELIAEVAQHYLRRALKEANDNKTEAAKLVGLSSYQTFTNWMEKYGE